MKKIFFYAMMLVTCSVAFTSCNEDRDSNPMLIQPTEFVVNTPVFGDGLVNLSTNRSINLTWSGTDTKHRRRAAMLRAVFTCKI